MADAEYTGFMYAAHRDVLVVENLAKEIDPYTEAIADCNTIARSLAKTDTIP